MPSKKINIFEGDFDSRMPLVAEEVFRNGIPFNVKFVGAMDIPRPTSRVEIVAAMRRVRFDFKAQGIKKRKVTVTISTDGIRTCTMHTKKPKKDAQNGLSHPLLDIVMEAHPIYRIFYVAHDSQDVKIFSYIARETSTSVFRCVVLKASSKNQAMKVVRTLGQAFEVSHSLNGPLDGHDQEHESSSQVRGHEPTDDRNKKMSDVTIPVFESPEREKPSLITAVDQLTGFEIAESLQPDTQQPTTPILKDFTRSLEVQLLRDKLEQSTQAVSAAVAQITLLNDQLKAESAARIEAQARTHQLLLHNNELLGHLRTLIKNINELEGNVDVEQTSTTDPSHLPQVNSPSFLETVALRKQNAALLETILDEENRINYLHRFAYCPSTASTALHYNSNALTYPYIPFSLRQAGESSTASSLCKHLEDLNNMFTRATIQPSSSTAAAPARLSPILDMMSVPKPALGATHAASSSRFAFEGQIGSKRRPHGFVETGPTVSKSGLGGNGVKRSVSEKINTRSKLMNQVSRSIYARHTTK